MSERGSETELSLFGRWARDWNPMTTQRPRRFFLVWTVASLGSTLFLILTGAPTVLPILTGIAAIVSLAAATLVNWELFLRKERFFKR